MSTYSEHRGRLLDQHLDEPPALTRALARGRTSWPHPQVRALDRMGESGRGWAWDRVSSPLLRLPAKVTIGVVVVMSVALSELATVTICLLSGESGRELLVIGSLVAFVIPLVVATPVSIIIVRLVHDVDVARRTALNLAWYDDLTRVLSRRRFRDLALQQAESWRRAGLPVAVAILDLDDFKRVNDTRGHAVGDLLLQRVAEACNRTVHEVGLLGRWGGEEFVVLLPAVTELGEARMVMERVRRAAAGVRVEGGGACTVSIGVAMCGAPSWSLDEAIKQADNAMYEAKAAGKDRVVVMPSQVAALRH